MWGVRSFLLSNRTIFHTRHKSYSHKAYFWTTCRSLKPSVHKITCFNQNLNWYLTFPFTHENNARMKNERINYIRYKILWVIVIYKIYYYIPYNNNNNYYYYCTLLRLIIKEISIFKSVNIINHIINEGKV